jgi:GDSL-like Lipase/Acylhydrolase family
MASHLLAYSPMTHPVKILLPDARVQRSGLPSVHKDSCSWRLPAPAQAEVPLAVAEQSRYGAGARLRFRTNSGRLQVCSEGVSEIKSQGIDCLIDGRYWRTLQVPRGECLELMVFQGLPTQWREIDLYFPAEQEIRIDGLVVDDGAGLTLPTAFAEALPLVFYGSSVVQGAGAGLAAMSYPSILSRQLDIEAHNWGFYGAGKAEPEVVAQVIRHPAKAFVLDLGKSYGRQPAPVYRAMLEQIVDEHRSTPIVVLTPIFSARENYDQRFFERSELIRRVMTEAAQGIENVTVVDGLTLLGCDDWAGLSVDGLHPNEKGFELIAQRLLPTLESLL